MNTQEAKEAVKRVLQETHDTHITLANVSNYSHGGTMLWADLDAIRRALPHFVEIRDLLTAVLAHLTEALVE